MSYYKYKAKDENGKLVTGGLSANDELDLHSKLKNEGKYLIAAKEEVNTVYNKRLKSNALADFCRNVGELLNSGVTLVKALKIISEDEAIKPKDRKLYASVLKQIMAGTSFSDAMEMQGDAFPPLLINMIKSSESTGNLDDVALQMASYYEKDWLLTQKVKSSMTYPKMLIVLLVVVVAIIMGYVIPQFDSLFSMMDKLPVSTSILLAISEFVKTRWYVIIFVAILVYAFFKILFTIPKIRILKDKIELHIPKIGYLRKVIYTARFARTLASLYAAGLSINNCMNIAKSTIGNTYIEKQFDQVIADIRAGENLSTAIDKVDGFTKKLVSTIAIGEETGALDKMLVNVANQMEYDSEMALNRLVSYLEPAMIVIMAAVVGFVIIAVIQPIYGSYEAIANSY